MSAGPVEAAIRLRVTAGDVLHTPARARPFSVARVDDHGVVLLLGAQQAWTAISWPILEGVMDLLADGRWVQIGGVYETGGRAGTLDAYLKGYVRRATAGWVAALLEHAALVDIDRRLPNLVRLRSETPTAVSS